jgi:transcription elongation factor GreB
MSKAFTKEEDDRDEDDAESMSPLPSGKNYITPAGAKRLRDELNLLLDETRPEIVRVVSWAASNGDRSENGDYIYGKRRLREIDKRIRFLTKRLEIAEVVNPSEKQGDTVLFGATVTLENEDGAKKIYAIVGVDETDVARGRISWISPMGKALLQAKKGDVVTIHTPRGEEDLEILDVKYAELP